MRVRSAKVLMDKRIRTEKGKDRKGGGGGRRGGIYATHACQTM
jgi:hypothetical protein